MKIRKLTALCLMMVMSMMTLAPALSVAGDAAVGTSLTRSGGGGGTAGNPDIKAKWEMLPDYLWWGTGTSSDPWILDDDVSTAGAQFDAPGVWGADMNYEVCAIVTDPNGMGDINGVYADIYYPENIAFHPMDPASPDQTDGGTSCNPDFGLSGCGAFIEENTLLPLTKDDGYELFCETIRLHNNNLPKFFDDYDWNDICGVGTDEGQLRKETAKVYCDAKTLTWEDPAGSYKVEVFAVDTANNFSYINADKSDIDLNHFDYLPYLGFAVDFDAVSYGEVALSLPGAEHKKIAGDLNFETSGTSTNPTVRNVGNQRLYMLVAQDDMGLGQTSSEWNVKYDARVGGNEDDWSIYDPYKYKGDPQAPVADDGSTPSPNNFGDFEKLEDILDLSETEEMDFSILITKFPSVTVDYSGTMTLSCTEAEFRRCY